MKNRVAAGVAGFLVLAAIGVLGGCPQAQTSTSTGSGYIWPSGSEGNPLDADLPMVEFTRPTIGDSGNTAGSSTAGDEDDDPASDASDETTGASDGAEAGVDLDPSEEADSDGEEADGGEADGDEADGEADAGAADGHTIPVISNSHHLGDDRYTNEVVKSFSKAAEGQSRTANFSVPGGELSAAAEAEVRVRVKGAEEPNPLYINGELAGHVRGPATSQYTWVSVVVDIALFKIGGNLLTIECAPRTSNPSDGVDDFEFTNVNVVLLQ